MDNVILLYSKYPVFQINDELENYPIVIEIETDDYTDGKFCHVKSKDGVDVYTCSDTIYLNPFHCHVYFNDDTERQGVLTKAESSLENKFSKLYSKCFEIRQTKSRNGIVERVKDFSISRSDTEFQWDASYKPSDIPPLSDNKIKEDTLVDRIKGFLYCYLIGANTAVSPEVAELRAIAIKLQNTLSAAFNSPYRRPTEAQDASLKENIKTFNDIFVKTDESSIENRKRTESRLSQNPLGLSVEQCIKLFDHYDLYKYFCEAKLRLSPTYDAYDLFDCFNDKSSEAFDRTIRNLRSAVNRVVAYERLKTKKQNINELIEIEHCNTVTIRDTEDKPFYEKLVQSQINGEYKSIVSKHGVETSLAIAFNGGRLLKEIYEGWENSEAQTYINNLLNHFQESTPFNVSGTSSDILKSFAVFCQKGGDIDRLLDYMEQCKINNPKFVLGLYGATYGFASLPKTFTSQLIDGDKEYYKGVYLAIYKDLFGRELADVDFHQIGNISNAENIPSPIHRPIGSTIEPTTLQQSRAENAIQETPNLEKHSPKEFMDLATNMLGHNTAAYRALIKENFQLNTDKYTQEELHKMVTGIINPKLPKDKKSKQNTSDKLNQIFSILYNTPISTEQGILSSTEKRIAGKQSEMFCDKNEKSTQRYARESEHQDIAHKGKSLLEDTTWIEKCSKMIEDKHAKETFKKDMKWVVEQHHEERGAYYGKPGENTHVKSRLHTYMTKRRDITPDSKEYKNKPSYWKGAKENYQKIPIEKIIAYLSDTYDIR